MIRSAISVMPCFHCSGNSLSRTAEAVDRRCPPGFSRPLVDLPLRHHSPFQAANNRARRPSERWAAACSWNARKGSLGCIAGLGPTPRLLKALASSVISALWMVWMPQVPRHAARSRPSVPPPLPCDLRPVERVSAFLGQPAAVLGVRQPVLRLGELRVRLPSEPGRCL